MLKQSFITPQLEPSITYPYILSESPRVVLDQTGASQYYLWFPKELAHDLILIRIQSAARSTGGIILADLLNLENGYIILRVNLAKLNQNSVSLINTAIDITDVICAAASDDGQDFFLSSMFPAGEIGNSTR